MNINEKTIIYFETRENITKIENRINEEELLSYNNSKDNDKLIMKFRLSFDGTKFYYLFTNKKMKFNESINLLKTKYPTLKDLDIVMAINNGNYLLNENNKNKNIEELDINYNQYILLIFI